MRERHGIVEAGAALHSHAIVGTPHSCPHRRTARQTCRHSIMACMHVRHPGTGAGKCRGNPPGWGQVPGLGPTAQRPCCNTSAGPVWWATKAAAG